MSPLKIQTLLNLHVMAHPFAETPMIQVYAPAMIEAFQFFGHHGLLALGVSHSSVVSEPIKRSGSVAVQRLSAKGQALVVRLCTVEPPAPVAAKPAPAAPVEVNLTDYTIDRYAKRVINGDPERFDAIELEGVRLLYTEPDGNKVFGVDNDNPDQFSVYLHLKEGGVECVGDFTRYTDALAYALELSDELSLEVYDHARPK